MMGAEKANPRANDSFDTSEMLAALIAVRKGDFTARLPNEWTGINGKIADAFNEIVEMNQRLSRELERVGKAVGKEGKLTQRIGAKSGDGAWNDMAVSFNTLLDDLVRPTAEMSRVIGAVAKGDLTQSMSMDVEGKPLQGEFLRTSKTVNAMVQQLSSFASEVTRVAREVGTDGKLGGQAQVKGVSGTWKDLTDSVNSMAGNLTSQVRNIANVTTAVAKGDLSQKITVDAKGEILELKNTINTMVEQLSAFASEVTRVAREVGTDGKLGGQAAVSGVAGTWKDLTDSVNGMASNLTNQVRNIAQVTTAVATGDLSKKITVDAKGEILKLKNTINTMVDQLNAFAAEVTRVARVAQMGSVVHRKQAEMALKASEEKFRGLFESSRDAIMTLEPPSWRFTSGNPATVKMFGAKSEEEFTSPGPWELSPERQPDGRASAEKAREMIDLAVREGSHFFEWRHRRIGGEEFPADVLLTHMEQEGKMILQATVRDITERKRGEEALMEKVRLATLVADINLALTTGETLRQMLASCAEALAKNLDAAFARIWTINDRGDMLELQASAGMYTHLDGFHSRVPVGKFKIGLIAQERKPHLTNTVVGDPRVDQEWARREGMVSFAGYPLVLDERLLGVMAIFARKALTATVLQAMESVARTISLGIERKRAGEALWKSEERFRALFEESKDVVFFSTPDGKFMDINAAGIELFGYASKEQLLQIDIISDLYSDPDAGRTYREFMREQGYVKDYELVLKKKDGSKLTVLETSTTMRDTNGAIVAYRGIMRDVTHFKELQQQLMQAQKIETIGQLAGGVAHDFNNILMAVSSYCELLRMKLASSDPSQRFVDEMLKTTERGASLTRQLLAFSRRQVLRPKILDMNQLLADMDNMLRRLIGEDIDLVSHLDRNLGLVKVDPGQMEQIIMNLAVNSRDAMPVGGKLSIETANVDLDEEFARNHLGFLPGRYVSVKVSDNGCGMGEATLSHIFEPFFTTKETGKGTGLGLATVFGIVKQSEGFILVDSRPNQGTAFSIYLPRVDEPAEARQQPAAEAVTLFGSETILLVDDNDSIRNAVGAFLEMRGYKVRQAADGKEALELAERQSGPIDLLVTDVVMPQMSGFELAKRLEMRHPAMKVLYMSGYTDEAVRRHGMLETGTAFLQKPAHMETLLLKIRELLSS